MRLRRLLPRNLATWLLLLMVGTATAIVFLGVQSHEQQLQVIVRCLQQNEIKLAAQTLSVALDATPDSQRAAVIEAANMEGFRVTYGPLPTEHAARLAEQWERIERTRLPWRATKPVSVEEVRARHVTLSDTVGVAPSLFIYDASTPEELADLTVLRQRIDTLPTYATERMTPSDMVIYFKVANSDNWLRVEGRTETRVLHFAADPQTRWMMLAAAMVLCLAALAMIRLTRPLGMLAEAAKRLGVDADAKPIPIRGTAEMRVAARAFNQMQQNVLRLMRERATMAAAVSHDLRTPIQRLRFRGEFVEEIQRDKFYRDLDEMDAMITQALVLARSDAAGEAPQEIDLAAMLRQIAHDHAEMGQHVTLAVPDAATYHGRVVALKRAVQNLVDNAIAYGERAAIALSITQDGTVAISVADDGPGIPEDRLQQVLQPFERLDHTRAKRIGGFGLGLAAVRLIVESHGGKLTLANRTPHGLVATLHLPRPS